jgi:hypothetical protein
MVIECARCKATNDLDEGMNREEAYCHSCFAPLSESYQTQFPETIAHNEREIEKLKWRPKESS